MLEITIQRRVGGGWPVVAEHHRPETLLPVRSEGRLELDEPSSADARAYGRALGRALFRDAIRDAFVRARGDQPDGVRVLLFVEAEDLKAWRWEWLCAPGNGTAWDFLSLDQRVLYSLYIPSLTERAYPPIGRNSLRALVVVANPADPERRYGLASFDANQNVARLQSIFGDRSPATVLARTAGAAGSPTLEAIETHLTGGTPDGSYTILHLVCHGWVNPHGDGETTLYLERPNSDPTSGQVLAQPIEGTALIERLGRVSRLPYLVFLSACESAAPEAEQRLGGLAQRLVRELGIPAVIGMTERVTVATAHALAEQFYSRLFAQTKSGEVDRALVQAYAGLVARPDVNVPALYSRLGERPLFSTALDRPLTADEIKTGLQKLGDLLLERAPVTRPSLAEGAGHLQSTLTTSPEALSVTARQERDRALTRVNELCSEAVEISFHALAQGEPPPAYDVRQPFRGLSPFRAEEREFFFGRDGLVQKLLQKLTADNFLAVLGPSGSGKSSLVLAGLAPALKTQTPDIQVVEDLTPGSAPLDQLKVRQSRLGPGCVLYIVDQFEELFTLCTDEDQRIAFIDELLKVAENDRVVLTMRADFWGECARYPALKERMVACQELIGAMTEGELRSAMEQQAAKVGLRFEADLSNRMLDEVAGEPGAMPLLQHALLELWKRRHGRWLRAEEYRTIRGVKQAIAETADRLYNEASPAEQDRIQHIFIRLTQVDDNAASADGRRDTRRRRSLSELVPVGSGSEEIKALVKRLADNVLVVTSRNELTGQVELEVSHEALIRHWPKLLSWIDRDRAFLQWLGQIKANVELWSTNPADEGPLLRGGMLAQAMDWLARRRDGLNKIEDRFIEASIALCRREEKEKTDQINKQRRIIGRAFVQPAQHALDDGDSSRALRLAAAGALLSTDLDLTLAPELWSLAARAIFRGNAQAVLSGHADVVVATAFSPNGKLVATASSDHTSCLWDAETGAEIAVMKCHEAAVQNVSFSPDGTRLVTASSDKTARLWDVTGVEIAVLKGHEREVVSAAFSPSGRSVVTASSDNAARLWDVETGTELFVLRGHEGSLTTAAFSPDGNRIVTASYDRTARLWNPRTGANVTVFRGHQGWVESAAFSPDGMLVVTASSDKTARLWIAESGIEIAILKGHTAQVWSAGFSPDGRHVVTASSDKTARLWDVETEKEIAILKGHEREVGIAAFSPDGRRIVTASSDNTARLWDADTGQEIAVLKGHEAQVRSAAFSPDGRRIATASSDFTARLWRAETGNRIAILKGHEGRVQSAAFSPDGKCVVTASSDSTARLWNAESGLQIAVMKGHEGPVRRAAFSVDGKCVVTASEDFTARVWNAETGAKIATLKGHKGPVWNAAISHDGKRIVTVSRDHTAYQWNARTGAKINVLEGHEDWVWNAAFSPDDKRVLTVAADFTGRLWDVETGKELAVLLGHRGSVDRAAFSPDGKYVVTASSDFTARLWDVETGTEVSILEGHQGEVRNAIFSPDSKHIVTASRDNTARLWRVETGLEVAVLKGHELEVRSAVFSPDSKRVVTASSDNTTRLWDVETATEIAVLKDHDESMWFATFSPNGKSILTISGGPTVCLWDVSRSEVITRSRAVVLTSALANGIGRRSGSDRHDILLQDAPDDMFSDALNLLGCQSDAVTETVAALNAPLHPNCYLSPSAFAAKFRLNSPSRPKPQRRKRTRKRSTRR
jgi:WD40 repeat protein